MSTIIKKPIITEKATAAADKSNSFSFEVDRKANKLQIKSAVEKMYGVNVVDVRTLTYGGGKSLSNQVKSGKRL
jgi:large subunit ribosomal protein L23